MKNRFYSLVILFPAIIILISACGFFPMPETKYIFKTAGPPNYFYDGFEEHDGTISTRYYYDLGGRPKPVLDSTGVFTSAFSVKLAKGSRLSTTIDFPESGILTFWVLYHRYDFLPSFENFTFIDDASAEITALSDTGIGIWINFAIEVPAGKHKISWGNNAVTWYDDSCIFLDEIVFLGFMKDAIPVDKDVFFKTTPSFQWNKCPGAEKYHLQVSTDKQFSKLVIDENNIPVPSFDPLKPLDTKKNYFWRIRVYRNNHWEPWSKARVFGIADSFVFESFEDRDDNISNLNLWISEGDNEPIVTDETAYHGNSSLKLEAGEYESIELKTVNYNTDYTVINFLYSFLDNTVYTHDFIFSKSGDYNTFNTSTKNNWASSHFLIEPGLHELSWTLRNSDSPVYLDGINIFSPGTLLYDGFETNNGVTSTLFDWIYSGDSFPYISNNRVKSGDWAIEFYTGDWNNSDRSTLVGYTKVAGPSYLSFYTFLDDSSTMYISVDDNTIAISKTGLWVPRLIILEPGIRKIDFSYVSYNYNSSAFLDEITVSPFPGGYANDSFESGDFSGNEYALLNAGLTVISDATAPDGSNVLKLEEINSCEPNLFLPVYFETPVKVSFFRKLDSNNYQIVFYVDNVSKCSSATTAWSNSGQYTIPAGHHILNWRLERIYGTSSCGYIDNIVFQAE